MFYEQAIEELRRFKWSVRADELKAIDKAIDHLEKKLELSRAAEYEEHLKARFSNFESDEVTA